jgi:hypothetical protein
MRFITEEKEIKVPTNGILCFYSSTNEEILNKLLFTFLLRTNENNISCIDVDYFKTSLIRFNIKQIPTIVLFKNDVESDRAVGIIGESELVRFLKQKVEK